MRVVVTGADGFLGWHTRLRLLALTDHEVVPVSRATWGGLGDALRGADAVVHLAGVNRGPDEEVEGGNVALAEDLAAAVGSAGGSPRVVYANSIHEGSDTAYGRGKARARELLAAAAGSAGGSFVDVRLPNVFGEHGRPRYNSFVATFAHAVAAGEVPEVADRPVELLHAQDAAGALVAALDGGPDLVTPTGRTVGVQEVLDTLREMKAVYDTGTFPDLSSPWRVNLFNTYRAAAFPAGCPVPLVPHADARGHFVETVRSLGGQGQSSISTTVPGITRGEHFHLRKVERFAVIQGTARISLRRVLTDEVLDFDVTGEQPVAIDMPVGWAHNITNTGEDTVLTQFWSHELFDPTDPDTYPEPVRRTAAEES